jgi:hypothetical protein
MQRIWLQCVLLVLVVQVVVRARCLFHLFHQVVVHRTRAQRLARVEQLIQVQWEVVASVH